MRALVTGVAGFLGGRLAAAAAARDWAVTGTFHKVEAGPSGVALAQMDLTQEASIRRAVELARPQVILHAAAMARPDDCAADPALCDAVNNQGTRLLAQAAQAVGAKMVFVSTDLVYDGAAAPYGEDAAPSPLGVYGRSKLNAEQACTQASSGKACLARTVLMYGATASQGQSFLWGLTEKLRKGDKVTAFTDQIRSPIEVTDLCEALLRCAERDVCGVIHLAGPESLSRLSFALKAAKTFKLDPALIQPGSHAATRFPDPRPADVSLNIERMRKDLDLEPSDVEAGLERAKEQMQL